MYKWNAPGIVSLLVGVVLIVFLDQWTKGIATANLNYAQPREVLSILNWTLLHNYGAAFSFLSDAGGWQRWFFTGISVVVSLVFIIWLFRLPEFAWLHRYSLMFILAGAVGNLIDRVVMGYVVDFISVHWDEHFFPAFNIADMSICFGAMLMILDIYLNPENH